MALSTYSELKSAIANWLNRSDLTSEIANDFIKLTEADFNSKLRIRQMEQIDSITINAETVAVPTGFIAVKSFYVLQSSTKFNLEFITHSNLFKIRGSSTTGLPRVFTIESDNTSESFRFAPIPDSSYTGYIHYYKAFAALSDANTSNYILTNHPSIYLYGSLFHAANFLGGIEPNQLSQWINMYATALERCEDNDKSDSYGSAPVVQRTDIGTDLSFYRKKSQG